LLERPQAIAADPKAGVDPSHAMESDQFRWIHPIFLDFSRIGGIWSDSPAQPVLLL